MKLWFQTPVPGGEYEMSFKGLAVVAMVFSALVIAACAATDSSGFDPPPLDNTDAGSESSAGSGGAAGAGGGETGAGTSGTGGVGASAGNAAVQCSGAPAACDGVGATEADQAYGCCDGDTVYYCKDVDGAWILVVLDCAEEAEVCGYDPGYEAMYCLPSGDPDGGTGGTGGTGAQCIGTPEACEDIGASEAVQDYGCCQGSTVYYCMDVDGEWKLQVQDCAATGESCGFDDGLQVMGCIEGGDAGTGGAAGMGGAAGAAGAAGEAGTAGASGNPVPSCPTTPKSCDNISSDQAAQAYGCCMDNVVYYCADELGTWTLLSSDCEATQQLCGYDPYYEALYCVD